MTDTWADRDPPVLRAAVAPREEKRSARREDIMEATGFGKRTVIAAIDALSAEQPPFFDDLRNHTVNAGYRSVAMPTGHARRTVGRWPSGESVIAALLQQLATTAEDDTQNEGTRSRARKIRDALTDNGGAVLTGVLTSVLTAQMGL
ncbi:hypothetical protein RN2511_035860 [Rhodococcus sp. NKCM2511]|uniref:hypothetical protein n=1 Tax=Rhodococcus sp. NKCM2511 TaxID=2766011 RepID=UPI001910B551|nr:hypothetical protein [Rhodococcus sp. NKCM2511]GHP18850.1 hypothetical protein RN2511_035860 [Rhodococcus sp. NKCM2511]